MSSDPYSDAFLEIEREQRRASAPQESPQADLMCRCGHPESQHETREYRGDKSRCCLICHAKGCYDFRVASAPQTGSTEAVWDECIEVARIWSPDCGNPDDPNSLVAELRQRKAEALSTASAPPQGWQPDSQALIDLEACKTLGMKPLPSAPQEPPRLDISEIRAGEDNSGELQSTDLFLEARGIGLLCNVTAGQTFTYSFIVDGKMIESGTVGVFGVKSAPQEPPLQAVDLTTRDTEWIDAKVASAPQPAPIDLVRQRVGDFTEGYRAGYAHAEAGEVEGCDDAWDRSKASAELASLPSAPQEPPQPEHFIRYKPCGCSTDYCQAHREVASAPQTVSTLSADERIELDRMLADVFLPTFTEREREIARLAARTALASAPQTVSTEAIRQLTEKLTSIVDWESVGAAEHFSEAAYTHIEAFLAPKPTIDDSEAAALDPTTGEPNDVEDES